MTNKYSRKKSRNIRSNRRSINRRHRRVSKKNYKKNKVKRSRKKSKNNLSRSRVVIGGSKTGALRTGVVGDPLIRGLGYASGRLYKLSNELYNYKWPADPLTIHGQKRIASELNITPDPQKWILLDEGSQGVVYKVKKVGITYALKLAKNPGSLTDEIVALKALKGITGVIDYIDNNYNLALLLEYIDGDNLHTYSIENTEFNNKSLHDRNIEILEITLKILKILEEIHDADWIHRDIKLGNIMYTKSKQIKIIDFGKALKIGDFFNRLRNGKASLTCCTKLYYSPLACSRWPHEGYDHSDMKKNDLWSLGLSVGELSIKRRLYDKRRDDREYTPLLEMLCEPVFLKDQINLYKEDIEEYITSVMDLLMDMEGDLDYEKIYKQIDDSKNKAKEIVAEIEG